MDSEYAKKTTSVIILAVLVVLSFLLLRPILYAIFGGLFLAFIFYPLYLKFVKITSNQNISATLICTILIIVLIVMMWLITPVLISQSIEIYKASQGIDFVTPLKHIFPSIFASESLSNEIGSVLYSFVTKLTNGIMSAFANLILNFPTLFLHMLVVLFTFFLSGVQIRFCYTSLL